MGRCSGRSEVVGYSAKGTGCLQALQVLVARAAGLQLDIGAGVTGKCELLRDPCAFVGTPEGCALDHGAHEEVQG
jgi:hypothetical protein